MPVSFRSRAAVAAVWRNSAMRLSSSLALLSENRCTPASRVPGTVLSSGMSAGSVSLSMPNWDGAPVILMLVVPPDSTLLMRSRQSATTPRTVAAAPT